MAFLNVVPITYLDYLARSPGEVRRLRVHMPARL
jgi:hypothetical protein